MDVPASSRVSCLQLITLYTRAIIQISRKLYKPVARIFRKGVTWMCNLHKHTRLGGSGGMLPQEIFRN